MKTVPIAKGRKAEDFATPEERDLTRAAVGSITWAAKEGRPDAAAIASLVASNLTRLSVQDIRDLNKAIDLLKSRSRPVSFESNPSGQRGWAGESSQMQALPMPVKESHKERMQ